MFANRRSSQKPHEEFYAAFKQSFPEVGPGTSSAATASLNGPDDGASVTHSEVIVDDDSADSRPIGNIDEQHKDHDGTPKPFSDQWRLTPSLMDPNSFAFSAFVNQPPGYYTPTPGGFNTFYHNSAAGDLHTPGMGMNTPLSLPHSLQTLHPTDPSMQYPPFNPQMLQHAHNYPDVFHQPTTSAQMQQLFEPPGHFLQHQDSGYVEDSPHKVTPTLVDMQSIQSSGTRPVGQIDQSRLTPSAEKFRFHTTLNAPTAMVRHSDEIPVTYLNKGQAYTMSIFDTAPPNPHAGVVLKYRTYVRISFEDEQQRAKSAACWQLWKEGRGTNEAHQRAGRLLAVEYVDPNQGGDEDFRKSQLELEKASFDSFVVTWYPNSRASGAPDCSISVRFNFLSTDFSHSKGVKGIPVRLCAKTQLLTADPGADASQPEVCFSKVKLFRDHGAERKLSNDVAHVKKSIDKLKQQIAQTESGMSGVGKRKRSGSMATKETGKLSAEEDLHLKLANLQDMFSSTRPVSVLFLKGDPEDDPDEFPVKLPGGEEIVQPIRRSETWESRPSRSDSPTSNQSPTPSSAADVTPKRKLSELVTSDVPEDESSALDSSLSPGRPVKVQKTEHNTADEVVALDVDSSYKPPLERQIKPVACFYVRLKDADNAYYRAIYLLQRTVKDLVDGIATKFSTDPARIIKVTHINTRGLQIIVDEDVVREVPEGQDMIVEFQRVEDATKIELEPPSLTEMMAENDMPSLPSIQVDSTETDPLEMWLNY